MGKNYIIGECCSVDDLRCSLRSHNPETKEGKQQLIFNLQDAIDYENSQQTPRVTIVKMLTTKRNTIQKMIK